MDCLLRMHLSLAAGEGGSTHRLPVDKSQGLDKLLQRVSTHIQQAITY